MLKRYFFLITLGMLSTCYSQTPETLFSQANQLYQEGKFDQALETYKQIPLNFGEAYISYNLGNCAYKLKDYGWALVYWRRAEKGWGLFNRLELIDNINLLYEETGKEVSKSPFIKAKNVSLSFLRSLPLFSFQLLFLILWLFLFIYLRFLYKKQKKFIILPLFALIALSGILLVIRYGFETRTYGVVISKQAPLTSGPGETFQALFQLQQAQEVLIMKEADTYYKVKALNRVGWISKKDVEKI